MELTQFNHLCATYKTARKMSLWPLRMFFAILEQDRISSMILLFTKLTEKKLEWISVETTHLSKILIGTGNGVPKTIVTRVSKQPKYSELFKKKCYLKEFGHFIRIWSLASVSGTPISGTGVRATTLCRVCQAEGKSRKRIAICNICDLGYCVEHQLGCIMECSRHLPQ